jgi:hypothetical protein
MFFKKRLQDSAITGAKWDPISTLPIKKITLGLIVLTALGWYVLTAGAPKHVEAAEQTSCAPTKPAFPGYSFLLPDVVDSRSAYAPFFMKWDDYFSMTYDTVDWQKKENIEEWQNRFCDLPDPLDIEDVVYNCNSRDLIYLRDLTVRKSGTTDVGYPFTKNTFAQCLTYNGCTETVDYLIFARKCEDYATPEAVSWRLQPDRQSEMQVLIGEGKDRLEQCESNFLKLRYWYQIIRLAHYAGQAGQAIGLYNEYEPRIVRRKPSVITFWIMGHVAGALKRMGRHADAAYRFGLVFRHSTGKRASAFRSFEIRNDEDWEGTMQRCQSNEERATMYLIRAAKYRSTAVSDMREVYTLDPQNKQLPLVLVSMVQELEKRFLRTPMTDKLYGKDKSALQQETAARTLLDLQALVRQVVKDNHGHNMPLWRCMDGYLEVLAGDYYAAERTFQRAEKQLTGEEYDTRLRDQLEIWRTVAIIRQLDTGKVFNYALAFSIPKMAVYEKHPAFEPFLRDYISHYYVENKHPGKAMLAAYQDLRVLLYNPDPVILEDLLRAGRNQEADFLEMAAQFDTSAGRQDLYHNLLEVKGIALLNAGQPEAALLTLREIDEVHRPMMESNFAPFLDTIMERYNSAHLPVITTDLGIRDKMSRLQFVEKLFSLELEAKSAEGVGDQAAALYYYQLGLGYYNTSYFGYEWELRDYARQPKNWSRLAQGPVFPYYKSPNGNRENLDLSKALSYFKKAYELSPTQSLIAARSLMQIARCEQKIWFCSADCKYLPGSKLIPQPPPSVAIMYDRFLRDYGKTPYGQRLIKECKWLAAYAN